MLRPQRAVFLTNVAGVFDRSPGAGRAPGGETAAAAAVAGGEAAAAVAVAGGQAAAAGEEAGAAVAGGEVAAEGEEAAVAAGGEVAAAARAPGGEAAAPEAVEEEEQEEQFPYPPPVLLREISVVAGRWEGEGDGDRSVGTVEGDWRVERAYVDDSRETRQAIMRAKGGGVAGYPHARAALERQVVAGAYTRPLLSST